jgi:hypothetical protein
VEPRWKQQKSSKGTIDASEHNRTLKVQMPFLAFACLYLSRLDLALSTVVHPTDACIIFRVLVDLHGIAKDQKEREINCLLRDSNLGWGMVSPVCGVCAATWRLVGAGLAT